MRTFAFWLLGLICGFFVGGMVEDAQARYRPLIATQDEDAISCATNAERVQGFALARQIPNLGVIRINAYENMNPVFECDPVAAVRAVSAAGYRPYVTVIGGPRYAKMLARTVGHLVGMWGVWNEANHPGWQIGYMANSKGPSSYRKLVVRVTHTLRRYDPRSKVLIGELAPFEDLRFIIRTAAKGKRTLRVDGIAVHAYRWYEPPSSKRIGGMRGYIKAFRVASRRLARERRLCQPRRSRQGCRPVPIYVTEAGYLREQRGPNPIYSSADTAANLVGSWREACREKAAMMMHYMLVDNDQPSWDTALFTKWGPRPEFGALAGYLATAQGCRGNGGALGPEYGPPPPPPFIPDRPHMVPPTPFPELPNGKPAPPDVPPVVEPEPDPPRVEPPDPIGLPGPPEPVNEDPPPEPPVEPVPVDPPPLTP